MKPTKMKRYATFDAYLADQTAEEPDDHQRTAQVREESGPAARGIGEVGQRVLGERGGLPSPTSTRAKTTCSSASSTASALRDPKGLLQGQGKFVRHIKLREAADLDERAFGALLRQATPAVTSSRRSR